VVISPHELFSWLQRCFFSIDTFVFSIHTQGVFSNYLCPLVLVRNNINDHSQNGLVKKNKIPER